MKIAVVLVWSVLSMNGYLLASDCDEVVIYAKTIKAQKNRLPSLLLRNQVFGCTGIDKFVGTLDELDRDLIYIKALNRSRAQYDELLTDNASPQKYADLLSKESIDKLFKVQKRIYSQE